MENEENMKAIEKMEHIAFIYKQYKESAEKRTKQILSEYGIALLNADTSIIENEINALAMSSLVRIKSIATIKSEIEIPC